MTIRVATFNVHHCEGLDGIIDIQRIASVVADTGAELIGLQELDRNMDRSDRIDQPAELARLLGMQVHFFPTLRRKGGEYGIAIAGPPALENPRYVPLPQLNREEPRGAITASFGPIDVVVTHLSTDRRARPVQVAALGAIARGGDRPTVVMGDLNLGPRSLGSLRDEGFHGAFGVQTLARSLTKRQIDHVLVSPRLQVAKFWTLPTKASDHLPLVADLEL